MAKITYTNKVNTTTTPTPVINKVRDVDMNEIKSVVNTNDDLLDAANASISSLISRISTLENRTGWAFYQDNNASQISVTTSWTKLTINKLGPDTDEDYLPLEIRGTGTLWDESTNKITPIALGDTYEQRFDFTVDSKLASPTAIEFAVDIGGSASPTIIIGRRFVTSEKSAPFSTNYDFPLFVKNTFLTNGAQIFARTDVGSVTIGARSIFLERKHAEL